MSQNQDFFGLPSGNDLQMKTLSPLSQKIANSHLFKSRKRNLFQIINSTPNKRHRVNNRMSAIRKQRAGNLLLNNLI